MLVKNMRAYVGADVNNKETKKIIVSCILGYINDLIILYFQRF